MDSLTARMQSLPQELSARIRQLVFTMQPGPREVNLQSKLPSVLQVDRASRHLLASAYFGSGSVFIFRLKSPSAIFRWVRALSDQHRLMVDKIVYQNDPLYKRLRPDYVTDQGRNEFITSLARLKRERLACDLGPEGFRVTLDPDDEQFLLNFWEEDDDLEDEQHTE